MQGLTVIAVLAGFIGGPAHHHHPQFDHGATIVAETKAETTARQHREAAQRKARRVRRLKPFVYPSGKRFAVPFPIAACESGENYFVGPSGAYGLIPPFPQYMSPAEQDRVALALYREAGEGPWAPYEGGCAYR